MAPIEAEFDLRERPGHLRGLAGGASIADDIGHPSRSVHDMRGWSLGVRQVVMLGGREQRAFGDRPKAEHIVLLRRR
jgi:hypothetical protein